MSDTVIDDAHALLRRFLDEDADLLALTMELRPQDGDLDRAFTGPALKAASEAYPALWDRVQPITPRKPERTQMAVRHGTRAEILDRRGGVDNLDPTWVALAEHFTDGPRWFWWRFVAPGKTTGISYDGLVWLDDHFAWFPGPTRVLRDVVRP